MTEQWTLQNLVYFPTVYTTQVGQGSSFLDLWLDSAQAHLLEGQGVKVGS